MAQDDGEPAGGRVLADESGRSESDETFDCRGSSPQHVTTPQLKWRKHRELISSNKSPPTHRIGDELDTRGCETAPTEESCLLRFGVTLARGGAIVRGPLGACRKSRR